MWKKITLGETQGFQMIQLKNTIKPAGSKTLEGNLKENLLCFVMLDKT